MVTSANSMDMPLPRKSGWHWKIATTTPGMEWHQPPHFMPCADRKQKQEFTRHSPMTSHQTTSPPRFMSPHLSSRPFLCNDVNININININNTSTP
jgi:hypothetical protein